MKTKQKIFIDCDPGHDDAIALLVSLYSDDLEVVGVSTCSGNQTVEKTTNNAFNLLNFFNRSDIPLAKGNPNPLVRESRICPEIHGESGLDGFTFPKYENNISDKSGADLIIEKVLENKGIIVVTTGPMTNFALAIKKEPKILKNIKEIVLMGGSTGGGNITKAAEFNILIDPEAADICFTAGVPLRMLGLNVTRQILVNGDVMNEARKINTRGGDLFVKLMEVFNKNQREYFGLEAGPLHDPATIVSLINKKAFKFEKMDVQIDISNTDLAGKTTCIPNQNGNVSVATEVNLEEYWKEIYKALRRVI